MLDRALFDLKKMIEEHHEGVDDIYIESRYRRWAQENFAITCQLRSDSSITNILSSPFTYYNATRLSGNADIERQIVELESAHQSSTVFGVVQRAEGKPIISGSSSFPVLTGGKSIEPIGIAAQKRAQFQWKTIQDTYPKSINYVNFVDHYLRYIQLGYVNGQSPCSGSFEFLPGYAFLVNIFDERKKVENRTLIDAFYHEAIHSYIYKAEKLGSVYPVREMELVEIESPWTASRISGYSFFQACFVWYGLRYMWAYIEGEDSTGCVRAKKGFKSKKYSEAVDNIFVLIGKEAAADLLDMSARA